MKNVGVRSLVLVLLAAACGGDGQAGGPEDEHDAAADGSVHDDAGQEKLDASDMDAAAGDVSDAAPADASTDATLVDALVDTGHAEAAAPDMDAELNFDAMTDASEVADAGFELDAEASVDASQSNDASDANETSTAEAAVDGDVAPDSGSDAAPDSGSDAAVTCDDGNSGTQDVSHPALGCGIRTAASWVRFPIPGGGYLELDELYARLWSPLLNGGLGLSYADSEAQCAALTLLGVSDFKVPSIDDVRTLAGGCANTAPGGSCPLSAQDPVCTNDVCGRGAPECQSCQWGNGPNNGSYCRAEVPLCTSVWTSTLCSDCAASAHWFYYVGNGNFHPTSPATWPARCVAPAPTP